MILVVVFFQILAGGTLKFAEENTWIIIISVLVMFFVNYIVLEYLFKYYAKKQIQKFSHNFPEIVIEDEELNFSRLSEKVSELSQRRTSELDTMKEMETYRKEYIGNVSHELKTPLFSIQGYVETLMDGGVENLAIRDKYLDRIDKSVERLLAIVRDLDMINQFESGEINLNISKFDLNILLKEIIDLLEFDAQKRNAKIQLVTYQPQVFVMADKQKIAQVLINLISNAIYYSNRANAEIIIKISSLRQKIMVEVIDNGMGIKPEALPRIFERFYRVESSRSRREGGSGLGLAIVKHILEAHNENIVVESKYLEGTTFSFMLEKGTSSNKIL